jgi:hypothetical protein
MALRSQELGRWLVSRSGLPAGRIGSCACPAKERVENLQIRHINGNTIVVALSEHRGNLGCLLACTHVEGDVSKAVAEAKVGGVADSS